MESCLNQSTVTVSQSGMAKTKMLTPQRHAHQLTILYAGGAWLGENHMYTRHFQQQ